MLTKQEHELNYIKKTQTDTCYDLYMHLQKVANKAT